MPKKMKKKETFPKEEMGNAFEYIDNKWQPVSNDKNNTTKKSNHTQQGSIKILTMNILFEYHLPENQSFSSQRFPVLFQKISTEEPDLICLQEITPSTAEILCNQKWVQNDYIVSDNPHDASGKSFFPTLKPKGGQLILARKSTAPFSRVVIRYWNPLKKVIVATKFLPLSSSSFLSILDNSMAIACIHLSSDLSKDPVQKRKQQLSEIIKLIEKQYQNVELICGDFNFGDQNQENQQIPSNFIDVWKNTHNDTQEKENNPGLTFNPQHNTLAALTSKKQISFRYDRILYRNKPNMDLKVQETKLFATEPVLQVKNENNTQEKNIHLSDHFGLITKLSIE
eukprot:gb/GECH01002213.1/.p1 GENE.gb/GECH01002213.1/~~gb/GECH01002213.1/.p1  ORF type:complete len:340 (+),score=104.78 gb/GECH01002213.1/:1-1020(+)